MIITFDVKCEREIDDIFLWYELQKSDLGLEFIFNLNNELNFIREHPKASNKIYKNLRRHILKKFPYNIYYYFSENKSEIKILALLHESRNQSILKERMN